MSAIAVVEKILRECSAAGSISDDALQAIHFFFPREADEALDIVDRGLVTVYEATPSGRKSVWVRSKQPPPTPQVLDSKQQRSPGTGSDFLGECFCVGQSLCSCRQFDFSVRERNDSLLVSDVLLLLSLLVSLKTLFKCKHLLAVMITNAFPDKRTTVSVPDDRIPLPL